ncbi:MAG: acyl carrier protein [Clostridia bacterium]|nr:acyl carrier protein [Clostridia bacterium]
MTEQKVIEILAKQLRIDKAKIASQTNIASDLGADSLDLVEILMSLEDEFNISIPDEAIPGIVTVGDLVAYIDNNK